jgi:hypothetical protein
MHHIFFIYYEDEPLIYRSTTTNRATLLDTARFAALQQVAAPPINESYPKLVCFGDFDDSGFFEPSRAD